MRVFNLFHLSLLILLRFVNCDYFTQQPRIISVNGHIIFQSAENHNITFKRVGSGSIRLNDDDLVTVIDTVKETAKQLTALKQEDVATINLRIQEAFEQLEKFDLLTERLSHLETSIVTLTSLIQNATRRINSFNNRINGNRNQVRTLRRRVNLMQRLLNKNDCVSNPCRNGGKCEDAYNGYVCRCPDNWQGVTCEEDVNECGLFSGTPRGCQNGATCVNNMGSFECKCTSNWHGVHCNEKHDDCSGASSQELCGHGLCHNLERVQPGLPKYECICDDGWNKTAGPNPACILDIDECSWQRYPCSLTPKVPCYNTQGSYICGSCPTGYTGNGYICEDVNECLVNNGGCSMYPMVQCINTYGSRECGQCPQGFQGDGVTCSQYNLCTINNGGCSSFATCIPNPAMVGGRECQCGIGYVGSGIGPYGCTVQDGAHTLGPGVVQDLCIPNPCVHGTCTNYGVSYHCTCQAGFIGINCESQMNPCLSHPCRNSGTCNAIGMEYTCTCTSVFTGPTCEVLQQGCGENLNAESGSLRYPAMQGMEYEHNRDCMWTITTTWGKVINITFSEFHLEGGEDCPFDFVQINDGYSLASNVIGRFCGSDLPNGGSIVGHIESIHIWFHSDEVVVANGFKLSWTAANPECGEVLETDYGIIQSPGYPGRYPLNRDCFWLVSVQPGKKINFQFHTLKLEEHFNCSYDFLKIYDGFSESDPVIARYCQTFTPEPLTTPGETALLHFHSDEFSPDYGFHITYTSIPGIPGCGGEITAPSGFFTSPGYPDTYQHDLNCDWRISTLSSERIKLTFTHIHLEEQNCIYDFIEVWDGPNARSPFIGRYCGQTLPPPISSTSNNLYVKFHTDESESFIGFKAAYSTICGGEYTDSTGTIHSPYYPEFYPWSKECIYLLKQPMGKIIILEFEAFSVESDYKQDIDCDYDYLEIRDGHNEKYPLLAKLCGEKSPAPILSTQNFLYLRFVTDATEQNKGFLAHYRTEDITCGGVFLNQMNGTFTSPEHPMPYPHGTLCVWVIQVPPRHIISLTFTSFNLEGQTGSCFYDHVEMFDNATVLNKSSHSLGKFCGSVIPPSIMTMSDLMTVVFETDPSDSFDGFSASFTAIDSSKTCSRNYSSAVGFIRSPNYPNSYPDYLDCIWIITVPTMQQIEINITNLELEDHPECLYDYLEIRNGGTEFSPLLGQYCSQYKISGLIKSHGNKLYLHFHSDETGSGKGFQLIWDATSIGCGGLVEAASGTLSSPNYPEHYDHNILCDWKISVSHGSRIKIIINDLDIEELEDCAYDYLEILEPGHTSTSTKFCSSVILTTPILTESNSATVRFQSDHSQNGRGFSLHFETECNNVIKSGRRGVIESPNFPNAYLHQQNCTWTIAAPWGNKIRLVFSHLDIEYHEDCEYDYLEIRDNTDPPKVLIKYCNSRIPHSPVISDSESVAITFVSDFDTSYNGFRLEWFIEGCGGHYIRNEGNLSFPEDTNKLPRVVCEWAITVDYDHKVQLTINKFDLDFLNCNGNSLQIFGGPDATSYSLTTPLCHKATNPIVLTTMGNHMFLRYTRTVAARGSGFSSYWEAIPGGCSQHYVSPTGVINSPNYPNKYNDLDDCSWLITVEEHHTIVLTFQDFQLENVANCTFDYVAIFDGENEDAKRIFFNCSDETPKTLVRTSSSKMYVRFKADASQPRKGFKANYSMDCGGVLNANEGGILGISPSFIAYSYSPNCTWLIQAENPGDHVTLAITELRILDSRRRGLNCSMGSIIVYDGDSEFAPQIGRYCGFESPPPITSDGSSLYIVLVKGQNHSQSHFFANSMSLTASYYESSSMCGGNYTSVSGSFSSPGYPYTYPQEMECIWVIKAPPGNQVQLSFKQFDIEESENCNLDYLEIHETNAAGRLLGSYCGNELPSNLTASESFWIKFRSNEEGTAPGFLIQYNLLFGNEIFGVQGKIASPLYPHFSGVNGNFKWHIVAPYGMRIQVIFEDFTYNRTLFNAVSLYDGGDENSYVLARLKGVSLPEPIYTWGNELLIVYPTTKFAQCRFLLSWQAIYEIPPTEFTYSTFIWTQPTSNIPGCGGEVWINSDGFANITSPGFPHGYEHYIFCVWTVQTQPGYHISLNFVTVDLFGSYYNCYYDEITVYDGEKGSQVWGKTPLGSYCNRDTEGMTVNSTGNFMKIEFKTSYANNTGFLIRADSVCGGQLYSGLGSLMSPNHPNNYPPNQNCEWVITLKPGRTLLIRLPMIFDIEDSDACTDDYILLRNGATKDSPLLLDGKYCNTRKPPSVMNTTSNHLYVKFVSDNKGSNRGFNLVYEEQTISCGGDLILSSVFPQHEFTTPNFPRIPPPHSECKWIIIAPAGHRVQLDFDSTFDITDTDNCSTEVVEGFEGGIINSQILFRKCGRQAPETIWSYGNTMLVRYFTDTENEGSGFKATAKIAVCGGTFARKQGIITSPEYPNAFTNNLNCEWKIKGPVGHAISFTPVDYELPSHSNCSLTSHVSIRDYDDKELISYCGYMYQMPVPVNTSDNMGSVFFKSYVNTDGYKGFKITYSVSVDSCGGEFSTPSGVITSPNYPGLYAHKQRCYWKVIVPQGRRIRIEFTDFNLEGKLVFYDNQWNCIDQLVLIDGVIHYSPRLSPSLCGNVLPPIYKTSGNELGLYFYTDGDNSGGGFSLTYTSDELAICGGEISAFPALISSPFGPAAENKSIHCVWEVIAPTDDSSTLVFNLTDFKIEPRFSAEFQCYQAFLKILIGSLYEDSQLIYDLCGNVTDRIYVIPFNRVWLRYKRTINDNYTEGFNMTYNVQNCGGVIIDQEFTITTPNYPSDYGTNAHCAWVITVEEEQQIKLTFDEFNLDDKSNDYMVIYNGLSPTRSPKFGIYNATHKPNDIHSMGNSLWIEFHSDNIGNARGFKITGHANDEGCSGHYHKDQGSITSMNFPNRYPNNVECIWEITLPEGYFGIITFTDRFDIQTDESCSKDFVAIYEMAENEWQQINQNFCGKETPQSVSTKSNKFKVMFRTDDSIDGDGFKLNWVKGCGGVYTEKSGKIYSPGFPGAYGTKLQCNYLILAGFEDYIRLIFDENFEIENETNCAWDNITIYTGVNSRGISLGTYCGTDVPGPFVMRGGSAFIRFFSDSIVVKKGFAISYEIQACGGNLTSSNGTFSTPTHPMSYLPRTSCAWVIRGTEGLYIELIFTHFDMEDVGCNYDYVKIYRGDQTIQANLMLTLCGTKTKPIRILGESNVMTVAFTSDDIIHHTGFEAFYRSTYGEKHGCGGRKNTSTGSISSLDYDNDGFYEPFLTCIWVIETLLPNRVLKFTFDKFDIEAPPESEKGCPWDYLELRDGLFEDSRLINRFCGSEVPNTITSSGKSVWIKFVSDSIHNKAGFKIDYISVPAPCGGNLVATNFSKTLESPDYPYGYPPNTRCEWNITADRQGSVEIIFVDFELENSTKCSKDYLEVRDQNEVYYYYDNMQLEGAYCGKKIPHHFLSYYANVRLNFVSDNDGSNTGFKIKYQLATCNQSYGEEHDNGRIRFDLKNFFATDSCTISITALEGRTIALYFTTFELTFSVNCTDGSMKVYDGKSDTDKLITSTCGYYIPYSIFSTGNNLLIVIKPPGTYYRNWIDITYTTTDQDQGIGCGGTVSGINGSFTSPNYPNNYTSDRECQWLIQVPPGGAVDLSFREISFNGYFDKQTESTFDECSPGISVYDGNKPDVSTRLRNYCDSQFNYYHEAFKIMSTGHELLVAYRSHMNNTGRGFRAVFAYSSWKEIPPETVPRD